MVLHKAYMPRVLIETGFISNPTEGAKLDSEDGQNEIAQAIANAIISYKKDYFGASATDETIKPSQRIEKDKFSKPTDSVRTVKEVKKPEPINKTEKPKEVKKPEPKENPTTTTIPVAGVVFKVQLAASAKPIELTPSNFKGLQSISTLNEGNLHKYYYGETSNYEEAKRLLSEAKSKGYISAFIIAYKEGKKVSVQEALKH